MSEWVAINGKIIKPHKAKISVFDRGFLFGDGVYEVVRSYGGVLFALEDHIARLYRSADRISLDIGMSPEELMIEAYRVFFKGKKPDMYLRIVVTRGESDRINIDPSIEISSNIVMYLKNIELTNPQFYVDGVDLITATVFRNPKSALDPNIKSGNYLNNILAIGEAKKKKAYDALMTDRDGNVTEGPTWNVFMVKDGEYITPPDTSDILHGITRKILKGICTEHKLRWVERSFSADELKRADEAFSTGSVKEILPIRSLDGVKIGTGRPGPLTLKLAGLYKDYVGDYCRARKKK